MFALIAKELRYYANQRRYRRVQFVILSLLAFTLFAAAFELFSHHQTGTQTNVGAGLYGILVIVFFVVLLCFAVPVQIIEAIQIEKRGSNFDLLSMTPLNTWKLLAGKLIGGIIAVFWPVWLVSPLFWISIYTGGLEFVQTLACISVGIAGSLVFSMVGISFALFGSVRHAISRSYAVILPITLLPLILSHTFTLAPPRGRAAPCPKSAMRVALNCSVRDGCPLRGHAHLGLDDMFLYCPISSDVLEDRETYCQPLLNPWVGQGHSRPRPLLLDCQIQRLRVLLCLAPLRCMPPT